MSSVPGIPNFLLSGGQGGLTVSPSSGADSGRVSNTLNFGDSTGGGALSSTQIFVIGAAAVAVVWLMGRK